mgnify:CR=1 FL=1
MELPSRIILSLEDDPPLLGLGRVFAFGALLCLRLALAGFDFLGLDRDHVVAARASRVHGLLRKFLAQLLILLRREVPRVTRLGLLSGLKYRLLRSLLLRLFLPLQLEGQLGLGGAIGALLLLNVEALARELLLDLLKELFREEFAHLGLVLLALLGLAKLHPLLHLHRYELARAVHQLPLRERELRHFRLRLQLQRLVVKIVELLSVLLGDLKASDFAGFLGGLGASSRRLRENVVLSVEENVECGEDEALVDEGLDRLAALLAHLAAVDVG